MRTASCSDKNSSYTSWLNLSLLTKPSTHLNQGSPCIVLAKAELVELVEPHPKVEVVDSSNTRC